MSTHYLIDLFNDKLNAAVVATSTSETVCTGNYVVRVPDDNPVLNPADLADLLTQKYANILSNNSLFSNIAYDSMLDASQISVANSESVLLGEKGSISILPKTPSQTPVLETSVIALSGSAPSQAMLVYELFEYVDSDPKQGRYQRAYKEVTPDMDVSIGVSFNSGSTFNTVTNGVLVNLSVPDQGTNLVVRFSRSTEIDVRGRVLVGSWAVLY